MQGAPELALFGPPHSNGWPHGQTRGFSPEISGLFQEPFVLLFQGYNPILPYEHMLELSHAAKWMPTPIPASNK